MAGYDLTEGGWIYPTANIIPYPVINVAFRTRLTPSKCHKASHKQGRVSTCEMTTVTVALVKAEVSS